MDRHIVKAAMDRLTFCQECAFWKPYPCAENCFSEEIGVCNKPFESMCDRWYDDFCSKGRKKE